MPLRGRVAVLFCKAFAAFLHQWRGCLAFSALRRRSLCVPKRASLQAIRPVSSLNAARSGMGRGHADVHSVVCKHSVASRPVCRWQGQSRGRRLPPLRRYPGRKSARWLPECMENHEKTHFLEKKAPKVLRFQKNALPLHSQSDDKAGETLGYGVMVTLQILVLSFLVRVRVSQQRGFLRKLFFCLSAPMPHLQGCHAVCRAARRACKCLIFPNLFCPFAYLH